MALFWGLEFEIWCMGWDDLGVVLAVRLWRTIELVGGLELKFWRVSSAIFAGNCGGDNDDWLWVRVWQQEIFVLLLDLGCFEAIEGRKVRYLSGLSFVMKSWGELSWNCGNWVGNCWKWIWRWKIDGDKWGNCASAMERTILCSIERFWVVLCASTMSSTENEWIIVRQVESWSGIVEIDELTKSKVKLGRSGTFTMKRTKGTD